MNNLSLFSSGIINDGTASIAELREKCRACTNCQLSETRQNIVFGEGLMREPEIAFVGEAPGKTEDEQGSPFVGDAGNVLNELLASINYTRERVYICNTVACRPPKNRVPEEDEIKACAPFLSGQLHAVRPRVIVALGATAAKVLAKANKPIGELRGQWLSWEKIPLRATYHPAYLLRNPSARAAVLDDLQRVVKKLESLCTR
jgi:DNA polymerase